MYHLQVKNTEDNQFGEHVRPPSPPLQSNMLNVVWLVELDVPLPRFPRGTLGCAGEYKTEGPRSAEISPPSSSNPNHPGATFMLPVAGLKIVSISMISYLQMNVVIPKRNEIISLQLNKCDLLYVL